jgi:hypothetical protein
MVKEALWRWKQEDCEFQASLVYIRAPVSKNKQKYQQQRNFFLNLSLKY